MSVSVRPIRFQRLLTPGPQADLLASGYELRCTASGTRLAEIVAEYRRLGFDVVTAAHRADPDACRACFEDEPIHAKSQDVYVRRPKTAGVII